LATVETFDEYYVGDFAGVTVDELDDDLTKTYFMDTVFHKDNNTKTYEMAYSQFADGRIRYAMDIYIKGPRVEYDMGIKLILSPELRTPEESVINTIRKTVANQVDQVYQTAQMMKYDMQLETTVGDELDNIWGEFYNLRRRYGESDYSYRTRLMNCIGVMTTFGTKPNCESVINNVIGVQNGSTVSTGMPGTVKITYNSVAAMKAAETNSSTLDIIFESLFAAGITYSEYITYKEYVMTMKLKGPRDATYTMDMWSKALDSAYTYDMNIHSAVTGTTTYDMDVTSKIDGIARYYMSPSIIVILTSDYDMDIRTQKTVPITYTSDLITKKTVSLTYDMDKRTKKICDTTYYMRVLAEMEMARSYEMDITLRDTMINYWMDIKIVTGA